MKKLKKRLSETIENQSLKEFAGLVWGCPYILGECDRCPFSDRNAPEELLGIEVWDTHLLGSMKQVYRDYEIKKSAKKMLWQG